MEKDKKARYIVFLPFLFAFMIEIFVFNFRTFESMFNREIVLSSDNLDIQGAEAYGDGFYVITGDEGKAAIYLIGLNELLKDSRFDNVKLDISLPEAEDVSWRESGCMYITPYVRDGGHDRYDILAERVYRQDIEDSKFLWITPAGELKTIALNVSLSEGSAFQINSIKLNVKRGLHISFARLLIIILLAYACYLLRASSGLWEKDSIKKSIGNGIIVAVFGICLILPGAVINISENGIYGNAFRPYHYLAEALADGHLYLNEIPSEKLGLIDNPFDLTLREAEGIEMDTDYLWDMAYYNGKYYCYFGVVPCILFYLPVYLLTGSHLSDGLLMMILAVTALRLFTFCLSISFCCSCAWKRAA